MTNLPQAGISPNEMKGRTDELSASNAQSSPSLEQMSMFGKAVSITDRQTAEEDSIDVSEFVVALFRRLSINRISNRYLDDLQRQLECGELDWNRLVRLVPNEVGGWTLDSTD